MKQTEIANKTNMASLVSLKQLAKRMLPKSSTLRSLILSEPDYIPKKDTMVKLEMFVRLLDDALYGYS